VRARASILRAPPFEERIDAGTTRQEFHKSTISFRGAANYARTSAAAAGASRVITAASRALRSLPCRSARAMLRALARYRGSEFRRVGGTSGRSSRPLPGDSGIRGKSRHLRLSPECRGEERSRRRSGEGRDAGVDGHAEMPGQLKYLGDRPRGGGRRRST